MKRPLWLPIVIPEVTGRKVLEYLQTSGIPHEYFLFETLEVVPDEAAIGSLLMHFDTACDLVIGIGTGTINDMCRLLVIEWDVPTLS